MSKLFFTSDWHLNDDRLGGVTNKPNVFYRPFSMSSTPVELQNSTIIERILQSDFRDGDTLYHLGDVICNFDLDGFYGGVQRLERLRDTFPKSKFHLIIGNYDEDKLDFLGKYFDTIQNDLYLDLPKFKAYLNHYPIKCKPIVNTDVLGITGHIHGLWKVRPNMINVGVDAWHFHIVPLETIEFCYNAMQNFYDENVYC